MTAHEVQSRPVMLDKLATELQRGGAGTPAEIARRLGPDWTEHNVIAALADLFSDGVVGHNHDVGLWWVA